MTRQFCENGKNHKEKPPAVHLTHWWRYVKLSGLHKEKLGTPILHAELKTVAITSVCKNLLKRHERAKLNNSYCLYLWNLKIWDFTRDLRKELTT